MRKQPKHSGSKPQVADQPADNDMRAALWLGLALFFLYLLTTPLHQPYGDEAEYLAVAENILTQGSPALIRTRPSADEQLHDVITYSKFPLGQSLLMLPLTSRKMQV